MAPCRRIAELLGLVTLLVLPLACRGGGKWVVPTSAAGQVGKQIQISGVIRYYDLEGGFYAIDASDDVTYNPTNLPSEFKKDGLAVEAEAYRRDDRVGIHQIGPIVELKRIRRR